MVNSTLDHTRLLPPMRPDSAQKQTDTYRCHGTTSPFATSNFPTGEVIGRCFRKHCSVKFKKLLYTIDEAALADLEIHPVLDNSGTHEGTMIQ